MIFEIFELSKVSFGMMKLGEVSFGILEELGEIWNVEIELGGMTFDIFELGEFWNVEIELGEVIFGILKLGGESFGILTLS